MPDVDLLQQQRFCLIENGWQLERSVAMTQVHSHPHFEALFITRGQRCVWAHGREHKASAGSLILFSPHTPHCEYMGTDEISYFMLRFYHEEAASPDFRELADPETHLVFKLPRQREFLALFDRMIREYNGNEPGRDRLLGAYLVEFLVLLERAIRATRITAPVKGRNGLERISSVMSRIEENLSSTTDLGALARQAFMSPSHFAHEFKRVAGMSPRQYQIQARIREAKRLLAETDVSATEIAEELGYTSPFFFYRQFRSFTGYTTQQYRDQFRKS